MSLMAYQYIWGNCSVAKLADLEKIHLSAAKLIFKLPEIPGSLTGLPSSCKPIRYLYKLKILCLTHKICLLYTSPSPRDLSTSRMPSSA